MSLWPIYPYFIAYIADDNIGAWCCVEYASTIVGRNHGSTRFSTRNEATSEILKFHHSAAEQHILNIGRKTSMHSRTLTLKCTGNGRYCTGNLHACAVCLVARVAVACENQKRSFSLLFPMLLRYVQPHQMQDKTALDDWLKVFSMLCCCSSRYRLLLLLLLITC